ncbi:MAG: hypothetical protein KAV83_06785 [Desulfobacterales bacterium]|nr:hypothetical protein [Desulfobacterales bacterium]
MGTIDELKRSQLYSEELGIKLSKNDKEYFKWFLASLLFGGRISETIAKNTYRAFVRYGLLTPQEILETGWDFLVNPIMREGGYVRYDGRKSSQILRDFRTLLDEYGGSLKKLHRISIDSKDLENRLLAFYGVGPITVNIFLRELRPHWHKADPDPLPIVSELATKLNVDLSRHRRNSVTFVRMEAGLIRLRKSRLKVQARPGASAYYELPSQ